MSKDHIRYLEDRINKDRALSDDDIKLLSEFITLFSKYRMMIEDYRFSYETLMWDNVYLRNKLSRLLDAARPIAADANQFDDTAICHYHDSVELWQITSPVRTTITIGELRKLRKVYNEPIGKHLMPKREKVERNDF